MLWDSCRRSSLIESLARLSFSTFFSVMLISSSLYLSLSSRYSFALVLSSRSPSILPSISPIISFTLSRLAFAEESFFSDSAFLLLYMTTPAASSNISRLLSGLLLTISAIFPWPIMEYPSTPMPVSIISSLISRSLQLLLLIRYSLSPERYILLVIATSL